ncbi:MAG: protein-disulfide reductase DsbD family protein [Rhodospirillales bacterium]
MALFALAAAFCGAGRAWAAASAWENHEFARARLVSAVAAVGELQELRLGLQFKLNPHWKTYWRSPGDAGLPAKIDWSGSENLSEARVLWPAPERHTLLGIETLGYENEVLLPILARPKTPGRPVRLRAQVDYLVCENICVPAHAAIKLDLPAGAAVPSAFVDLVDRWRAKVPGDGAASGLSVERAALAGAELAVKVAARERLAKPDLLVEGPPGFHFGQPRARLNADGLGGVLLVPVAAASEKVSLASLAGAEATLTLIDGARTAEFTLKLAAGGAADAGPVAASAGLGWMLLVAVLGGLILNLMPCVLPVLSLKLLGVVGHGGGEGRAVRLGFVAASAGILASFLALAGFVLALRWGGMAVGWGVQFQQPVFILGMALIVTLFACNLWGWFEIGGPRWAFAAAETGAAGRGLLGHFLTGALATLLATPCSAPFLGTAVGFALARGPLEIVAIFLALGLGLALPYLAVAAFPALATRLPRPGRWMLHLRRVLGLGLALTAVWLLTVLAAQRGGEAAILAGALLLIAALVLALRARLPEAAHGYASAAIAVLALGALSLPATLPASGPASGPAPVEAKGQWRPFDEAAIAGLVAAGRVVFVDVTADWCVTCLANKTLVLNRGRVAERLGGKDVVAMRADWTRPDPAIALYLAKFGRYGIPFNVVYGPAAPAGIPLPELLTGEAVLAALDRAGEGAGRVAKTP